MSEPIRIIAWGNRGRRDDGVALVLADRLQTCFAGSERVVIHQYHQLGPEVACDLDRCRLAIFIDADVRPDRPAVSIEPVTSATTSGLNTHHCKPSELLALAASMGFRTPPALLVAIPASDLNFGDELSPSTLGAMLQAEQQIIDIIKNEVPAASDPSPGSHCHA